MMEARRSFISLQYQGIDISKDISNDLLSFTYTDHASGEADDISIDLEDKDRKWIKSWFPNKGDVLKASINTKNWRKNGDKQTLPCGRFFIDQPEYRGRPSILTIGAIASPLNSNFSSTERSKVWKNITIKAIATDIAKRSGLEIQFIGSTNPRYKTLEQSETADSTFLSDLCEKEGLAMKVTDSKIVIFDEKEFEKRPSVEIISETSQKTLDYSFKSSLANTAYDGVNVKYYDPKIGRKIEYLFTIGESEKENPKIYQVNSQINSADEARRFAQKTLRKLNKNETTGMISVVGNVKLLGSCCVDIKNFGGFDGKYFITKASHTIGSGYKTDIEIRKVLEGY